MITISEIASIATLILFVIYFIGRIISIIVEKSIKYEIVDLFNKEDELKESMKIVDEYRCTENYSNIIIITPKGKAYNWIKIYECNYNERKNSIVKTKLLYKTDRIYNDTSFRLNTIVSCGIPQYVIEFERSDYMKGILYTQCNGKNGIQEEILEFKHSLRSVLYYLFK